MPPQDVARPRRPHRCRCTADAAKSQPLWVGTDVLKALAGRPLANLVYTAAELLSGEPPDVLKEEQQRSPEEKVRCAEVKAAKLLQNGRLREALAQLETCIYIKGKDSSDGSTEWLMEHAKRLAASAISWALDLLVTGPHGTPLREAFESLCLAECLTRVAICGESPERLFLRSLCLSGLGTYYWLRKKPQAALKYLTQAASKGHGRWVHPATLLNLSSALGALRDHGQALEVLNEAVLALRSSVGSLFGDKVIQTEEAAREAICSAIEAQVPESAGFASAGRVAPGETLLCSKDELPKAELPKATPSETSTAVADFPWEDRGVELHLPAPDLAVSKALYTTQLLLKPWPVLHEGAFSLTLKEAIKESERSSRNPWSDVVATCLSGPMLPQSVSGLQQAAERLCSSWSLWAKFPATDAEVPGVGLLMRELIVICFFNTAATMSQVCTPCCLETWLLPVIQQGLALSLVFFDSKHPLALMLTQSLRKAAKCSELYRTWLINQGKASSRFRRAGGRLRMPSSKSPSHSRPNSAATGTSSRSPHSRPLSAGTLRAYASPRPCSQLDQVEVPSRPGTANSGAGNLGGPPHPWGEDKVWAGEDDSGWDVGLVVQVVQDENDTGNKEVREPEGFLGRLSPQIRGGSTTTEEEAWALAGCSRLPRSLPVNQGGDLVNQGHESEGIQDDDVVETARQDLGAFFEQYTLSLHQDSGEQDLLTASQIEVATTGLVKVPGVDLSAPPQSTEIQNTESAKPCTASPEQRAEAFVDRLSPPIRGVSGATKEEAFILGRCSRVPQVIHAYGARPKVTVSPVSPSPRVPHSPRLKRVGAPEPASPSKSPARLPMNKVLAEPVLNGLWSGQFVRKPSWPLKLIQDSKVGEVESEAIAEVDKAEVPGETNQPSTWALSKTPANRLTVQKAASAQPPSRAKVSVAAVGSQSTALPAAAGRAAMDAPREDRTPIGIWKGRQAVGEGTVYLTIEVKFDGTVEWEEMNADEKTVYSGHVANVPGIGDEGNQIQFDVTSIDSHRQSLLASPQDDGTFLVNCKLGESRYDVIFTKEVSAKAD